jgi:hypothetical protein
MSILQTVGYALAAEAGGFVIEKDWLLFDNQANIDVFVNGDLLTSIRKADTSLTIHSTSGTTITDLEGDFEGYGTVWYHPDGIANILSLSRVDDAGDEGRLCPERAEVHVDEARWGSARVPPNQRPLCVEDVEGRRNDDHRSRQ